MSDYISREAALEIVKRTSGDYAAAFSEIRKLPADVEPVRHGNWNIQRSRKLTLCLVCSVCGRKVDNRDLGLLLELGEYGVARHLYPYCHCGAKMDLEGGNGS